MLHRYLDEWKNPNRGNTVLVVECWKGCQLSLYLSPPTVSLSPCGALGLLCQAILADLIVDLCGNEGRSTHIQILAGKGEKRYQ